MTYVLPEKLKDLNPYDPVTEDFRIHLDANESFCESTGKYQAGKF